MSATTYLEGAVPYSDKVIGEYIRNGWWMNLTYGDLLDRSAHSYPDKPAVIDRTTSLSYAALTDKVDRMAVALLELGIKKHDRILIQLPNRHEFVVAFYAAQRIGAVPLLAVVRQDYAEISYFFKLAEPVAWLVPARDESRDFIPLVNKIKAEEKSSLRYPIIVNDGLPLPEGCFSMEQLIEKVNLVSCPPDYLRRFRPDPNDVAVIFTTGGTTGRPKGVPRTHNSFLTNVRYTSRTTTHNDVAGLVTPIGHTMAQQGPVGKAIMYGATLVLVAIPRAKEILESIEKWHITTISMVPTQLDDILKHPELERYNLASLKEVRTAGAALRPEIADKARRFFDKFGAYFRGGGDFGSTEGPCAGGAMGASVPRGSVGRPFCEGDHWKAIDESENDLPVGIEGELVAKGPCVFTGYYRSETENAAIFTRDGHYKMGDVGRLDGQGNIFITGRKKDIIQRGAEGIIPKQIEDLLRHVPSIQQAAVIGMPDPRLGEKACAYVVLKPGATLTFEEMQERLRENGAGVLLLPERLEIIDALPKTALGKIDKTALRNDISEKLHKEGLLQVR